MHATFGRLVVLAWVFYLWIVGPLGCFGLPIAAQFSPLIECQFLISVKAYATTFGSIFFLPCVVV